MKRAGCLYERLCGFDNLLAAYRKAFRGTGRNDATCRFAFHLERELLGLQSELKGGTYGPQPYRYFTILDPKERVISVAPFRDRVVHHALVRVIEPVFERRFIFDSYATRKGKGTHRAIRRAQSYLGRHRYFLKMDVNKYFDSVDHGVLIGLVARKIKDPGIIELVGRFLSTSDASRGAAAGKGLPIGNLTSQFFANVYLDPLDHFVKDELGVKGYIRYMDDMVAFSDRRKTLKGLRDDITGYLDAHLKLQPKPEATLINRRGHGLPFLGMRVFPRLVRVKSENVRRVKGRIARRVREYASGAITEEKLVRSISSMFAHLGTADSYNLRRGCLVPGAGIA